MSFHWRSLLPSWLNGRSEKVALSPPASTDPAFLNPGHLTHPGLTPGGYWANRSAAPRLLVISGAGLSAESGLATFREKGGLWQTFDPAQVCTLKAWQAHHDQVHAFHDALRAGVQSASPNTAHHALSGLNDTKVVLATQNVDGLLERAGARDVLNLHGRLDRLHCTACAHFWAVPWSFQWSQTPLAGCPACGGVGTIKPGIVMFGERAPLYRPLHNLIFGLRDQDVVAVIGTAGNVLPLRQLLANCSATKWLLNLEASPDLPAHLFDNVVYGPATRSVPELAQWWQDYQASAPLMFR